MGQLNTSIRGAQIRDLFAGDGLVWAASSGTNRNYLAVNVDDSSIGIFGDALFVKDDGITNDMILNESITVTAGSGIAGGGSVDLGGTVELNIADGAGITVSADSLDVNVDGTTIGINGSDQLYTISSGINHNDLDGLQGGNGVDEFYHLTANEDSAFSSDGSTFTFTQNLAGTTLNLSSTLDVTGNTTLGSTLDVSGDADFYNNVNVSGTFSFDNDVTVNEILDSNDTLGPASTDDQLVTAKLIYDYVDTVSGAMVHNELEGLQGGTANEYYHLDANTYNAFSSDGATLTITDNVDATGNVNVSGTFSFDNDVTVDEILDSNDSITSSSTDDQIVTAKLIYDYVDSVSGTVDHGSLLGLGDQEDHTWVVVRDGSRELTANWDAGDFTISAHAVDLTCTSGVWLEGNRFMWAPGGCSDYNTSLGLDAGDPVDGEENVFVGYQAGNGCTEGTYNVAVGSQAGYELSGAGKGGGSHYNTLVGNRAGYNLVDAHSNILIGSDAGLANVSGDWNVIIGTDAGDSTTGESNVFIGGEAGHDATGDSNVFIGRQAGYSETGSGTLYIENSNSATPLIYGDFTSDYVWIHGDLGVRNGTEVRFYDVGNSHHVGFEAPALTATQIWVLPDADGNANEVLYTDGGGNLGWLDVVTETEMTTISGDIINYVDAQDTAISGSLQADIIWEIVDTPTTQIRPKPAHLQKAIYTEGNVTIGGDLTVTGTLFYTDTETVQVSDNILHINYGEVGAGVTAGEAGIQVDRGSETDYYFVFDEGTDTFRIGVSGSQDPFNTTELQPVATREDDPLDHRVTWWDDDYNTLRTQGDTYITVVSGGAGAIDFGVDNTSVANLTAAAQRLGPSDDTYIYLNQGSDNIEFNSANTQEMRIGTGGMKLKNSTADVNEILNTVDADSINSSSTDDQLATAKLIYNYIDTVSGAMVHNELEGLQGGDGGADEYYHLNSHEETQISATTDTELLLGDVSGDVAKITINSVSGIVSVTNSGSETVRIEAHNLYSYIESNRFEGPAGGVDTYLSVGKNDSARGTLELFGKGTGSAEGGLIRLNTAEDHDGVIVNYQLEVYEDDLLIGPSSDTDSLKFNGGTGVWEFNNATGIKLLNSTVDVNEILNTVDGDDIDAASTDDQLATAKLIYNELEAITTGSGQVDHNNLSGLQGGTTNEYYHMTSAQHTALTDVGGVNDADGQHSHSSYLTSFTESDPVFGASPAAGITNTDISQWDSAYSHSTTTTGNPHSLDLDDVPDGSTYCRVLCSELSSGVYQDATDSTKGIASFDSGDFTVTTGNVVIATSGVNEPQLAIVNAPISSGVLSWNGSGMEWISIDTQLEAVTEGDIAVENESSNCDGVTTGFTLDNTPVDNSVQVFLNGLLQEKGSGKDYTQSGTSITFTVAPETGDILIIHYIISG